MRAVFFGASQLGEACCRRLLQSGVDIAGLVTVPRTFGISYAREPVRNATHADFHALGAEQGLPVHELRDGMRDPALQARLAGWGADTGFAIGWYHLVPRSVRDLFPQGVLGLHASLLPKYRGGAPLVWAILEGERETGVSLFRLDGGVDTGPLLGSRAFPIAPRDTIRDLLDKSRTAALDLLGEVVPRLRDGTAAASPQPEGEHRVWPQRGPADGAVDWRWGAERLDRFVRAQTRPYPGAFASLPQGRLMLWEAHPGGPCAAAPGTVLRAGGSWFEAATGDGRSLAVTACELPAGASLQPGQVLA